MTTGTAILIVAALGAGFAAGWVAALLYRWIRRDPADINDEFARRYAEGVSHTIAGRRDEAIEQLTRAARLRTDIPGLYLILGDLYRQKGLFDRAIRIHTGLLSRADLSRTERARAHASLGDDFGTAGLVDRAREAYEKALELDPRNLQALYAMSRYRIEDRQWEEALAIEEQILRLDSTRRSRSLAFIYNEIGREHLRDGNARLAHRHFQKAIAVDDRTYPAHIFLGDDHYQNGNPRKAVEHWERVVDLEPRHLHLVFDRLEAAYEDLDRGGALEQVCRRIADRNARDWRVRVLLSRLEAGRGEETAAYHHLLDAARIFPQSLTVQREMWKLTLERGLNERLVQSYLDLTRNVNEFADPFVCLTCRYESLEYLWRCPRCFEWDTFSEDLGRAPAAAPGGPGAGGPPGEGAGEPRIARR